MIILDTNVVSEFVRPIPNEGVMAWLAAQPPQTLATATVVEAEILFGLACMPSGRRRENLSAQLETLFGDLFAGRVYPFERDAARLFAEFASRRNADGYPLNNFDGMISAIAGALDAAIATRDVSDFDHLGLEVINPWEYTAP